MYFQIEEKNYNNFWENSRETSKYFVKNFRNF